MGFWGWSLFKGSFPQPGRGRAQPEPKQKKKIKKKIASPSSSSSSSCSPAPPSIPAGEHHTRLSSRAARATITVAVSRSPVPPRLSHSSITAAAEDLQPLQHSGHHNTILHRRCQHQAPITAAASYTISPPSPSLSSYLRSLTLSFVRRTPRLLPPQASATGNDPLAAPLIPATITVVSIASSDLFQPRSPASLASQSLRFRRPVHLISHGPHATAAAAAQAASSPATCSSLPPAPSTPVVLLSVQSHCSGSVGGFNQLACEELLYLPWSPDQHVVRRLDLQLSLQMPTDILADGYFDFIWTDHLC
ncbi:uncharacterized protein LOC131148857 [Malania oleifera]|uniref:uncharacterized protein LOC131148857 n=1 Tax=Malania oleifera TaxID=397392 RepID=UPI0025AEC81E|nr:uncharacterized protein LOC131148857 [Malania oleifera]